MSDSGNTFAHKFLLASFMLLMVAVTLIGAMAYSNATRLSATLMVENRAIMEDIRIRLDKVEENE